MVAWTHGFVRAIPSLRSAICISRIISFTSRSKALRWRAYCSTPSTCFSLSVKIIAEADRKEAYGSAGCPIVRRWYRSLLDSLIPLARR